MSETAPDYETWIARTTVAIGLSLYLGVAAFLTLGAALAFGATHEPSPTAFAFFCGLAWVAPIGTFVAWLAGPRQARERRLAGVTVLLAGWGGWLSSAALFAALFPRWPEEAPHELVSLALAAGGSVPGLVAVAYVARRSSARPAVRRGAPAAWALATFVVVLLAYRGFGDPLRDALPLRARVQRVEFFDMAGAYRSVQKARLDAGEVLAYVRRVGLRESPGALPAMEYPRPAFWNPPRTPGQRWVDTTPSPDGRACATHARYEPPWLYVQRRCDP